MKKKHIGRAAAIFLGGMLALTFCSRTVYRMLMPQVQTARANGGILSYSQRASDYVLDAETLNYAYIAAQLPQSVRIDRVLVKQNQRVEVGDALAQLYVPEAESALASAREALARAEIAWERWDTEEADALLSLKAQIESAESPERRRVLQQELALVQQGIVNGSSRQLCYEEYARAQEVLTILENLQANGWAVPAPQAGWIGEIFVQAGSSYQGLSPMIAIVSGDVLIGMRWNQDIDLDRGAARIVAKIETVDQKLDCHYVRSNGGVAWLRCDESIAYEQVRSISLTAETGFIETLVSADALLGDSVYVLSTRRGSWGEQEYYAQLTDVVIGRSNGAMVEIESGLFGGEEIIISSTKDLSDGATVLLQGVYR